MKSIITLIRKTKKIDVNEEFKFYKYAIPEHEPIKLSTGEYLHIYRVAEYDKQDCQGIDFDVEEEAFYREMLE